MSDLYPNLFKNLTRNPISIILLDGRKQTMVYDKTTKLSTLFEETCALCNLDSENLFGFATLMDDYYAFLNLDTKVCKINFKEISKKSQYNVLFQSDFTYFSPIHKHIEDTRRLSQGNRRATDNNKLMQSTCSTKSAPVAFIPETSDKSDTPVIYFRIKSYVFPHCLRDKTTKSLYFLQLLRNVLDYKLRCVDEIYLQLGSYAIQAFYGDYSFILSSSFDGHHSVTSTNTECSDFSYSPNLARLSRISKLHFNFTPNEVQSGRYFEPKKFFPSWIIEKYTPDYLFKEIPQLHKGLHGMSRVESEFSYIRMASAQYSNFNMHLFPVRDQKMLGSHLTFMKISPTVASGKGNGVTMTKSKLWLGLSPAGLEMHQMKQSFLEQLSTLKWSDIDEVTHKSSRINIHVGCRNLKLNTNTKMQADHLFWLTRHMHMYQTKARLNATCTEEALESAERLKYHEKYVYMDLDDLKLHGLHSTEVVNQSDTTSLRDLVTKPLSARLPFVNTPAALPRRTPSKAKPLKNKDLMKIISSSNESSNVSPASSINGEKHRQYIKKSRQNNHTNHTNHTNTYVPIINKGLKSPEIALKSDADLLYNEDSSKVESDQNTSNVYDLLDDSSITSSINESDSKSLPIFVVKQPGRFVSLSRNRNQEDTLSEYSDSPEHGSMSFLPPPQEFRESVNNKIVKSNSFDTSDISRQNFKVVSQRHQSDPSINCVELSEHLLLSSNLHQDLYNPHATDDVRLTNISRKKSKDNYANSAGMKSWKSDVLFNLNTCLDDEDADGVYDSSLDEFRDLNSINDRLNSLPRRLGSFRDMINFSSSSDSDNDFDSVDISSISSFEVKDVVYTRLNISTQVAII